MKLTPLVLPVHNKHCGGNGNGVSNLIKITTGQQKHVMVLFAKTFSTQAISHPSEFCLKNIKYLKKTKLYFNYFF